MIQNINKNAENLAKQGMQVIALASKESIEEKIYLIAMMKKK